MPKLTPEVKRLGWIILPSTFGAGIYQISQFVDTFFATSLPQGSLTLLKMGDRLNQMPLGIVGIALGTAILPMLARYIQSGDAKEAQRLQANAFEMATLLTLPAAAALAICAPAFVGGKFKPEDGVIMSHITMALVAGLPAYVIVKILNPGFFARGDTKTPVYTALAALIFNVSLNIWFIGVDNLLWTGIQIPGLGLGIVGLAGATAVSATLNCLLLYVALHKRGWFTFTGQLASRIARQLIATVAMSAWLWWLTTLLFDYFSGSVFDRIWSLVVLVISGLLVYAAVGWTVGAVDKTEINQLLRRRKATPQSVSETEANS
jgi:putative peptidoglycan lipid II flippase